MKVLVEIALYFVALINPASKVFLLSSMDPPYSRRKLWSVASRSTATAFLILCALTVVGKFVLHTVFHVEIYSLKVAGGIVLFVIGLRAVQKGRFFEQAGQDASSDISIVPLGAPMIAGPGTTTAAISLSAEHGITMVLLALSIALAANFAIMLSSLWIGRTLDRASATGPLIRITGLIVAAVAVQMVLGGIEDWFLQVGSGG